MTDFTAPPDPLNSPHPIPWSWILATQEAYRGAKEINPQYYRTSSLVSPNQEYAAYSRLQLYPATNPLASRVSSVLFIEHLPSGTLQIPIATSPLSHHPLLATPEADQDGVFSFLVPVSWYEQVLEEDSPKEMLDQHPASPRVYLLARQFEGIFSSGSASDYGLVWDLHHGQGYTIAPTDCEYTYSVLLGWSQSYPHAALFRTGNLGKAEFQHWAVDFTGQTFPLEEENPLIYGEMVNSIWTGPQSTN